MSTNVPPLSVEIVPKGEGRFKSIGTLSWSDIPGFAILTGENGSGKTQLLELLAYHFSGAFPPDIMSQADMPVEVRVGGSGYKPEEIAFVPSGGRFSGGSPASLTSVSQLRKQALTQAQQHLRRVHNDIPAAIRASRIASRFGGRNPNAIRLEELDALISDADFIADDIDITAGLCHVFVAHRFKMLEGLERRHTGLDEDGDCLGPAPWDVVNKALSIAGFPYEVISPLSTKVTDDYTLRLKDNESGQVIAAADLSSGEKVLLQLVLWLYSANEDGRFPKLLLLDEPDAHLHPSMTNQFLTVISDVLVDQFGVRVIMSTHSPSVVALAPEGAVFKLGRGKTRVVKVEQRAEIISELTAGLVTVSRATKFCFVEDEDDVSFYTAVAEILMDHGPSRDPMALHAAPTIAFIAASVGAGKDRISGGCLVVRKWVDKLDASPLDRTFFGIIDRDAANVSEGRVYPIERYSIENYLLDPINLFCFLLDQGKAPVVPGVKLSAGEEHLLRRQPSAVLQAISGMVTSIMQQVGPELTSQKPVSVIYTGGAQVIVPSWVVEHRGHDLLAIAQRAFGGARAVTPPLLIKALRRARVLPKELANLMSAIQRAPG